ncbi:DUF563 domain-containing protein [Roseomonas sp. HF4]|uniref:glycosyltransferase family 61 protein n=1 Tax=Roseomonas sp. HF4 TaxID=2562313 RepID=UPI0010C04845|nr:glycosyltransferase family 61 protein [Roseomonas sp. HF4]
MTRIVYEDDHLCVVHRPGASCFAVATFGGIAQRPQGLRIWADRPVEALDLEAFGFLGKSPNWYPAEAMARAAPVVAALRRGPLIGYGYSMGGYAALKYGRLLCLDAALAVSPQVSIDPAEVPNDRRFHRRFDPTLHAAMGVREEDLAPFPVVVADPWFRLDRLHADRAGPADRVARIWLPFMRHATIGRLAGTDILRDALDLMLQRDAVGLAALLRARRARSAHWHLVMAREATRRGRDATTAALTRRAEALGAAPAALAALRATARLDATMREARGRAFFAVSPDAARPGAWAAANAAALGANPTGVPPDAVMTAINAALGAPDPKAPFAASEFAIAVGLPVPQRRMAAQRLAVRGHGLAALAVLLADPAVIRDDAARAAMVPMLGTILRDRTLPPPWRACVAALRTSILRTGLPAGGRVDPGAAQASRFQEPGPAARRALARVPRVLEGAGVVARVAREIRVAVASQGDAFAPPARHNLRLLRDVYVNDAGQIWGRDGTLHRSNGRPVPPASLEAMRAAPEFAEAAWAVEANRNIYHWTIDVLPGLAWRLDGAGAGMPVLIHSSAPGYVRTWLHLAAAAPLPLAEAGAAAFVRRLHFGPTGIEGLDPAGRHAGYLARMAARADAGRAPDAPRRLYVSRRDTPRRAIANEAALEEALAERGFTAVMLSGLPLPEQIALFRGAEVIAGPHGAGLVHLVAAPRGRRVFEILRESGGDMRPLACFARISRLAGHDHAIALVPFGEVGSGWTIDIREVTAGLDRFLADA